MIIMDFLNVSNSSHLWTIPVHANPTESSEEEKFVNTMANDILEKNRTYIIELASKIIDTELKKHNSNKDLRKKILIKNQIIKNINYNIINTVLNLAKEIYDDNIKQSLQEEQDIFDEMMRDENEHLVIYDFNC